MANLIFTDWTDPRNGNWFMDVRSTDGTFVLPEHGETVAMATSPDGLNWTIRDYRSLAVKTYVNTKSAAEAILKEISKGRVR